MINNKRIIVTMLVTFLSIGVVFNIFVSQNNILNAIKKAGIDDEKVMVLKKEKLTANDVLVFYTLENLKGIQVALVSKKLLGWTWNSNFGDIRSTAGELITYEYISIPQKDISVLYGSINAPHVSKVTVGYPNTAEGITDIVLFNENQKMWYTTLDLDGRKIIIRAKDDENKVLDKKEF